MKRRHKIVIVVLALVIAVVTIGNLFSCPFSNAGIKEATGYIVIQNESGVVWKNEFTYKNKIVYTDNGEGITLKPGNYTVNLVTNFTIDVKKEITIPPASQWDKCPEIGEVVVTDSD